MLQDRYESDKLFTDILKLTSAMDPVLAQIDQLLDDEVLYQLIRQDLAQRYPQTEQTGRNSTPVEVILRMLAIKRLYGFSYEQTEYHVRDSLVLRQFCRVYLKPVPDDTTLIRWAALIQPDTLEEFNQRLTQLARQLKVTRGRKLRTDGTVVETNIHPPSDSSLLADSVRVLGRTLSRARQVLGESRHNSARPSSATAPAVCAGWLARWAKPCGGAVKLPRPKVRPLIRNWFEPRGPRSTKRSKCCPSCKLRRRRSPKSWLKPWTPSSPGPSRWWPRQFGASSSRKKCQLRKR